jgi:hypothetical protein
MHHHSSISHTHALLLSQPSSFGSDGEECQGHQGDAREGLPDGGPQTTTCRRRATNPHPHGAGSSVAIAALVAAGNMGQCNCASTWSSPGSPPGLLVWSCGGSCTTYASCHLRKVQFLHPSHTLSKMASQFPLPTFLGFIHQSLRAAFTLQLNLAMLRSLMLGFNNLRKCKVTMLMGRMRQLRIFTKSLS